MSSSPSTSIGIAIAPLDGADAERCCKNADLALYRAKEAGRGTFAFFEESLNERAQERRQLEADLRLALERGEFELYYQPLFDLEQNRIGSFEALLRWNHPTRGLVPPAEFIPIAEDTGLIVPIGAWVMREACRQAAAGPSDIRVAVNVSPVQFHRAGLQRVDPAGARRQRPRAGPARDRDHRIDLPRRQRGDACSCCTACARSASASRSTISAPAIRRSAICRASRSTRSRSTAASSRICSTRAGASAIVRAITELANALGMETTAEGVEETAQLTELRSHGCSSVQGFLFAEPIDPLAFRLLTSSTTPSIEIFEQECGTGACNAIADPGLGREARVEPVRLALQRRPGEQLGGELEADLALLRRRPRARPAAGC